MKKINWYCQVSIVISLFLGIVTKAQELSSFSNQPSSAYETRYHAAQRGSIANNPTKLPVVQNEFSSDYHCDCFLADCGCKKNQKCYRYCVRACELGWLGSSETIARNSASYFLTEGKSLSKNVAGQANPLLFNSSWTWRSVNSLNQYRTDFINAEGKQLKIE